MRSRAWPYAKAPVPAPLAAAALDKMFIERLWRSLKYELIYPGDHFYNHQRPHQALDYHTPAELFPYRPKRKRSSL